MNAPASTSTSGSRRGTFRGEIAFSLTALRLLASLALELAWNLLNFFLFVFVRRAWREKVRRIVIGEGAPRAAALALAVIAVLAVSGCGSVAKPLEVNEPLGDALSFKGQVRQLEWSWRALADQSDSKKSLEQDLEAFKTDPKWQENLRFDVENLFLAPDSKKSLEDDLRSFSTDDYKKHGLKETLQMLGW